MTEYQLAAMDRAGEHGEPIFRAPSVGCSGRPDLLDATEDYLQAQDALDNRELNGINAEDYFVLMRRRNAARRDLDAVLVATGETS